MKRETFNAFVAFLDRQAHLTEDTKAAISNHARLILSEDDDFNRIKPCTGVMRILNKLADENPMVLDCVFDL